MTGLLIQVTMQFTLLFATKQILDDVSFNQSGDCKYDTSPTYVYLFVKYYSAFIFLAFRVMIFVEYLHFFLPCISK